MSEISEFLQMLLPDVSMEIFRQCIEPIGNLVIGRESFAGAGLSLIWWDKAAICHKTEHWLHRFQSPMTIVVDKDDG